MTTAMISYGLLACLAIALLVAAATDLRRREIDNGLNAAIAAGAPLFWWAAGLSLWPGVAQQVGIALAVFLLLCGLFAAGAMGGGDVKLLSAVALWLPWRPLLQLIVLMALIGGALTIACLAVHAARRRPGTVQVPYGVAIAAAGLVVLAGALGAGAWPAAEPGLGPPG
jgi:prepilin peptidase CpaA